MTLGDDVGETQSAGGEEQAQSESPLFRRRAPLDDNTSSTRFCPELADRPITYQVFRDTQLSLVPRSTAHVFPLSARTTEGGTARHDSVLRRFAR